MNLTDGKKNQESTTVKSATNIKLDKALFKWFVQKKMQVTPYCAYKAYIVFMTHERYFYAMYTYKLQHTLYN